MLFFIATHVSSQTCPLLAGMDATDPSRFTPFQRKLLTKDLPEAIRIRDLSRVRYERNRRRVWYVAHCLMEEFGFPSGTAGGASHKAVTFRAKSGDGSVTLKSRPEAFAFFAEIDERPEHEGGMGEGAARAQYDCSRKWSGVFMFIYEVSKEIDGKTGFELLNTKFWDLVDIGLSLKVCIKKVEYFRPMLLEQRKIWHEKAEKTARAMESMKRQLEAERARKAQEAAARAEQARQEEEAAASAEQAREEAEVAARAEQAMEEEIQRGCDGGAEESKESDPAPEPEEPAEETAIAEVINRRVTMSPDNRKRKAEADLQREAIKERLRAQIEQGEAFDKNDCFFAKEVLAIYGQQVTEEEFRLGLELTEYLHERAQEMQLQRFENAIDAILDAKYGLAG